VSNPFREEQTLVRRGEQSYVVLGKSGSEYRALSALAFCDNDEDAVKKAGQILEREGADPEKTLYIAHVYKKVNLDVPVPPVVVTELVEASE
jgi:hypothetical protein